MTEAERLGARIKRYRELAGLSKSELARRVRVSPTAVHNWEENGVNPGMASVMEIADVLGMDIMQLAKGDGEEAQAKDAPLNAAGRRERIEDLKRQVADLFGVSRSNVEITIRA